MQKSLYKSLISIICIPAKVYKVDSSKAGQKTLLLRNNSGPVLEAIFHEIDVKMVPVEPGKHFFKFEIFVDLLNVVASLYKKSFLIG